MATKNHLTAHDPLHNHDRAVSGMAHYAGTGPAGKVCRECQFWSADNGRYAGYGRLKPRRCVKFKQMMPEWGPPIEYFSRACKHFVENPNPPAEYKRDEKA